MEKNRFVQLVADMLYRTDRESFHPYQIPFRQLCLYRTGKQDQ